MNLIVAASRAINLVSANPVLANNGRVKQEPLLRGNSRSEVLSFRPDVPYIRRFRYGLGRHDTPPCTHLIGQTWALSLKEYNNGGRKLRIMGNREDAISAILWASLKY